MLEALFYGLLAGFLATAVMSVIQLPFWRRWSTAGILEWHENQMIMSRLTGRDPEKVLAPSFVLHFANGGIAAAAYALVVAALRQLAQLGPFILGAGFGVILWVFTLALIHRPITGVHITKHPLGWRPVTLSFLLHILYGIIVALIVDSFI